MASESNKVSKVNKFFKENIYKHTLLAPITTTAFICDHTPKTKVIKAFCLAILSPAVIIVGGISLAISVLAAILHLFAAGFAKILDCIPERSTSKLA